MKCSTKCPEYFCLWNQLANAQSVCKHWGAVHYHLSFSCAWQQMHPEMSAIHHRSRKKTTKKPKQSLWLYLVTTNPHSVGKAFVCSWNVWFCDDWDVNYLSRNLIGYVKHTSCSIRLKQLWPKVEQCKEEAFTPGSVSGQIQTLHSGLTLLWVTEMN